MKHLINTFTLLSLMFYSIACTKHNGTLKIGLQNSVSGLDPAVAFEESSLLAVANVYETLYQYHYLKRPYEIIPLLAQNLPEISDDKKRYRIKIRDNIFYAPSNFIAPNRKVTAEDFINQFKRILFQPTKSSGTWAILDRIKGAKEFQKNSGDNLTKMLATDIEGIKAIDDLTLEIQLTQSSPQFLSLLCMSFFTPIPKEVILKLNNKLENMAVGTGPYKLKEFKENHISLVVNENFRKEKFPNFGDRFSQINHLLDDAGKEIPFIKNIELIHYKNDQEKVERALKQELDLIEIPKSETVRFIDEETNKKNNKNQVISNAGMSSRWISFNSKGPYGKIPEIRKAIALTLNIDDYIEHVANNTVLKGQSIFAPGIPGFDPSNKFVHEHDIETAKKLISKIKKPIFLKYLTRGDSQSAINEANYLKEKLDLIGITLIIEINSFKDFLKKAKLHQFDMITDGWIYDYLDSENILNLMKSKNIDTGSNKAQINDKDLDELISLIEGEDNLTIKAGLMYKIDQLNFERVYWLPLYVNKNYYLFNSDLKNFRPNTMSRNYLKYLKF